MTSRSTKVTSSKPSTIREKVRSSATTELNSLTRPLAQGRKAAVAFLPTESSPSGSGSSGEPGYAAGNMRAPPIRRRCCGSSRNDMRSAALAWYILDLTAGTVRPANFAAS